MSRRRSLARVLAGQWIVFGLSLLAGFALVSVLLLYMLEDAFIDRRLREAARFVAQVTQAPALPARFEAVREDRLETDEHDRNSQHCLLHTEDAVHEPVGCTRVVMTDPDDRSCPLPFEITCAATLDRSIIDPAALALDRKTAGPRHRRGQRLRPAHAAKATRQDPLTLERSAKVLTARLRKGLIGTLHNALGADIDPRSGSHLTIHGKTFRFE